MKLTLAIFNVTNGDNDVKPEKTSYTINVQLGLSDKGNAIRLLICVGLVVTLHNK